MEAATRDLVKLTVISCPDKYFREGEEITMSKEHHLHLQHSESVVAQMSATIFAAFVRNQVVTPANEDAMVEQAVTIAAKLASRTEKLVKSDQEWVQRDSGTGFLSG